MENSKITVGVLRGGPSSEYEVSLKSGGVVLKNLEPKYRARDIFISKNGEWHMDGLVRPPEKILKNVDVAFNALHGEYGEDGKVQGVLDSIGIPYTGSKKFASALAMNKAHTKKHLGVSGIRSPYSVVIKHEDPVSESVANIFRKISPPYIVKPVALGSSVGIRLVKSIVDLEEALIYALQFSPVVIVEEFIFGKEATCAVVDHFRDQRIYAFLPIEIRIPKSSSFFDYHAKYSGQTEEISPGNFTFEEKQEIQRLSALAHEALGLRHYSRSDFIVSPTRGVCFLETNTLPGLTEESLLPKSLYAVGSNLPDFLDHVVRLALEEV